MHVDQQRVMNTLGGTDKLDFQGMEKNHIGTHLINNTGTA